MIWQLITRLLCLKYVTTWLINNAPKRAYLNIDDYMDRWWLLPGAAAQAQGPAWLRWCPVSIRLHHIKRGDSDRHLHDHPYDFRVIVLKGGYLWEDILGRFRHIGAGETYSMRAEEFHRIHRVSEGGAWTLFVAFKYRHRWGFLVNGHKVQYQEYLAPHEWCIDLDEEQYVDAWAYWQTSGISDCNRYARELAGAPRRPQGMVEKWTLLFNADGKTGKLVGSETWSTIF